MMTIEQIKLDIKTDFENKASTIIERRLNEYRQSGLKGYDICSITHDYTIAMNGEEVKMNKYYWFHGEGTGDNFVLSHGEITKETMKSQEIRELWDERFGREAHFQ